MGVLNVTPDSFSDGGRYFDTRGAIEHGLRLCDEGADLVDVGGESTRPGSAPVGWQEERDRVVPVIRALAAEGVVVSVDTSKAPVAEAALEAGAEAVNDVRGLSDPAMMGVVADRGAGTVIMHMQGTPTTMQDRPHYENVLDEVRIHLSHRVDEAVGHGIERQRLCVDPGIGFGKTFEHNLTLLRHLGAIVDVGVPVVLGTSRKAFLGAITGVEAADQRDPATAGTTALAVAAGVFCVRVHDVPGNLQSARTADAIVRARSFDEVGG